MACGRGDAGAGRLRRACLSPTPPAHLYRVTAVSAFPANLPPRQRQLLVDLPQAPAGIDTAPDRAKPLAALARLFRRFGVDRPGPDLVQNALLASFENSEAITARRPRIGRTARGSHSRDRNPAFRGGVRSAHGAPPQVWVGISTAWSVAAAPRSSPQTALRTAVRRPTATTSHRSSPPSTRQPTL